MARSPHTGVIDWFQYNGNTYILEAINWNSTAAHAALAATEEITQILGPVNLGGETPARHTLTL